MIGIILTFLTGLSPRTYLIVAAVSAFLFAFGMVWHIRGKLDAGSILAATEDHVERIETHEAHIVPLDGPALLKQLRSGKY